MSVHQVRCGLQTLVCERHDGGSVPALDGACALDDYAAAAPQRSVGRCSSSGLWVGCSVGWSKNEQLVCKLVSRALRLSITRFSWPCHPHHRRLTLSFISVRLSSLHVAGTPSDQTKHEKANAHDPEGEQTPGGEKLAASVQPAGGWPEGETDSRCCN